MDVPRAQLSGPKAQTRSQWSSNVCRVPVGITPAFGVLPGCEWPELTSNSIPELPLVPMSSCQDDKGQTDPLTSAPGGQGHLFQQRMACYLERSGIQKTAYHSQHLSSGHKMLGWKTRFMKAVAYTRAVTQPTPAAKNQFLQLDFQPPKWHREVVASFVNSWKPVRHVTCVS